MNNKNLLFGFTAAVVLGIAFVFASFVGVQKYNPVQNAFYKASVPTTYSINDNSATTLIGSTFVGPSNIGGRVRALLIDKTNPNIIFAGSCGGGLWKSSTGGTSWIPLEGLSQNLIVTSITQSSNGDLYVGTGEGFYTNDADMLGYRGFLGKGIFKSTNGGNNFIQISSTNPGSENNPNSEWSYINDLVYDQTSNKLYAATNLGLRVSNNDGTSWSNPIPSCDTTAFQVSCVANTVVVGFKNKCFVSTDGGNNFTDQSTGATDKLPSTGIGGISIAVAPSNSQYIYASLVNSDYGRLYNVYRSIDAGNTWTVIGYGNTNTFSPLSNKGLYNNVITVFPNNENKIIVGGANLWMWNNGGNWIQKSLSSLSQYDSYFVPNAQHRIAFNPLNNNIFYIASDGGISKSIDGGETYKLMYINFAATSFYSVALGFGDLIIGGTQGFGTIGIQTENLGLPAPQNKYGFKITYSPYYSCGNVAASMIFNNKSTFFTSSFDGPILRNPDNNFSPTSWVPFISARMGTPKYHSLVPFSYWESVNDYSTRDTVAFINNVKKMYLKNGDGTTKHYQDTIIPDQISAKIANGSIIITTGSQKVVDDGVGKLRNINSSGEELGTINYTTGAIDFNFKTAPSYGGIVELKYNVKYFIGDVIKVKSYTDQYLFDHTLTVNVNTVDTVYVKDIIQSKLFLATANEVWMTRKPLDFQKPPHWFNISKFFDLSDTLKSISNSKDGDCIFYGSKKGKLFRATNIKNAQDSITGDTLSSQRVIIQKNLTSLFNQPNRIINSIAIDPADANHIVITLGNYDKTNYIYESRNALATNPTFQLKQGNLPYMPVYTAIIEMGNPNFVIVGTENGLYYTNDISISSPVWETLPVNDIPHVPIFSIKQQIYDFPTTSYISHDTTYVRDDGITYRRKIITNTTGKIIIGTFGRGVYVNNTFKTPNDTIIIPIGAKNLIKSMPTSLNIYPNPTTNETFVKFNLTEKSNAEVIVMDIQGRIVNKYNLNDIEGEQKLSIKCNNFKNGTYYVKVITSDKKMFTGKFVVVK